MVYIWVLAVPVVVMVLVDIRLWAPITPLSYHKIPRATSLPVLPGNPFHRHYLQHLIETMPKHSLLLPLGDSIADQNLPSTFLTTYSPYIMLEMVFLFSLYIL